MQTGQRGRCALALFTRFLMRATSRAIPALVVAVMCLSVIAPVQAAEKAKAETAHTAKAQTEKTQTKEAKAAKAKPEKASAPAKTHHDARLPDDDIAMGMIARGRVSGKDDMDVLLPLTGTWDYVASFWTRPKAEPRQATGSVTNGMILNGRYLSSESNGTLNVGREVIPFEGRELIGFDNAKKSFSFVAVDTLTTSMTIGSGKFEANPGGVKKSRSPTKGMVAGAGKSEGNAGVLTESGRFTNPLTGVEERFRSEITFVDAGHYTRTIFAIGKSGKESKLMEFDYSRSNGYTPPAKKNK
jgi:Protein of unknown function (DUF1579)